nr:ribonuclease 1 [Tanacetum cinerariifolium]
MQIATLTSELNKNWPNLESKQQSVSVNLKFWEAEWKKHGKYSGLGVREYFEKSLQLHKDAGQCLKAKLAAEKITPTIYKTYQLADIQAAVTKINGGFSANDFRNFIDDNMVFEAPKLGSHFTWCNNQQGERRILGKRLHYANVGFIHTKMALRIGEIPMFMQERQDGMNKRYKSSGSSLFNTKDSGEGSINLNTGVRTKDENEMEEVHEVRRPKPMGRDQAKRKMKGGSASSASSFNMRELAKMMASEYVMVSDPYNTQKNQEMSELLKIKNRELELKAAELKILRMENRQRDEALYKVTTDEALKERLKQRLFG